MASTNDLTAQAHLTAGMQKLEVLRGMFLMFLEHKEQEVLARIAAEQGNEVVSRGTANLSEWLSQ